jgi:hypothetical protein
MAVRKRVETERNGKKRGWHATRVQIKIMRLLAKHGPLTRPELIKKFGGKRSPVGQSQLGFSEHRTARSILVHAHSLLAHRLVRIAPRREEDRAERFELSGPGVRYLGDARIEIRPTKKRMKPEWQASPTQLRTLQALAENGAMTRKELEECLGSRTCWNRNMLGFRDAGRRSEPAIIFALSARFGPLRITR